MRALSASVTVGRPRAEVFDLFGTSAGLKSWFATDAEVILAAGMYNFWGDATPEEPVQFSGHTRLVRVAAPESLCFGWRLRGVESLVDLRLTEAGGNATDVLVRHESLEPRPPEAGALHDFWTAALENLRLRAVTGRPQGLLDHAQRTEVVLAREVHGSAGEVFETLTDPLRIDRAFGRGARIEPRAGGEISFGWPEGGPRVITVWDPPHRLAYRWQYDREPETEVTWTIVPAGEVTRVELRHEGWSRAQDRSDVRARWFSFLTTLQGMVELGSGWERVRIEGAHGEV